MNRPPNPIPRLVAERDGFITAVRMLTLAPLPGKHRAAFAFCHPWFPVVGAGIGGLVAGVGRLVLAGTDGWSEASALAMLAAGTVFTRGLHLDGLGDWADGAWGGFSREKRLAIMKDSRVGSFGVIALTVLLLGKWIALVRLAGSGAWGMVAAAGILSRAMQVLLAGLQPYARAEGGVGRLFVDGATGGRTALAMLVAAALLAAVAPAGGFLPTVAAGAVLLTGLFGFHCRRGFGGVTGDLIGANSEGIELWALLCAGAWAA